MAANKRYYWLKLKNNFFIQPKIKKLRSLENGADLTIIYLKMQLLSVENEGVIYFEGLEEDIDSEVAFLIDEDVEFVKKTIAFLTQHELIEVISDELHLSETKASIGSETASTRRSRKSRENKKMLHCNTFATKCNTEIEKEIDIESREKSNVTVTLQSNGEYRDKSIESEKEESNTLTHNPIQSKATQSNHEEEKENTSHPPTQLSLNEYTRKFYELYDMYPNHEFKEQALKFWLSSKYDIETIEYIENGIRRYSNKEGKLKTLYYFLVDETWKDYIEIEKEVPGMDVIEEEMFRDLYK